MVSESKILDAFDAGVAEGVSMVRGELLKLHEVLEKLEDNTANAYRHGGGSYFEGQSDAYEHAVRLVEEVIYIFSDDKKPTL